MTEYFSRILICLAVSLLIIYGSILLLPLHGDECMDVYQRLKGESYSYAKFFEANCTNEVQQLLADTNAVSPRIFQRHDVSGVCMSFDGAPATNVMFAVRRHRDGWYFSFIKAFYADGAQLNANFSKRGITQIHWMSSGRKGRSFEIHANEKGREEILSYFVEPIGEGDDEDMYLSNIQHYEGGRLVREDPPCRLGEMIFENKTKKSHRDGFKR